MRINLKIFLVILLLQSCQNLEDNKQLGQMIGAAVGAVIGSNYGSGTSKQIYTILGSAGGFLIGGKLGMLLSETDKKDLNETIENSLEQNPNNVTSQWSSKTEENTSASITPVKNFQLEGNTCREFEKIIIKDKKTYKKNSKACRDEDGNWKILES